MTSKVDKSRFYSLTEREPKLEMNTGFDIGRRLCLVRHFRALKFVRLAARRWSESPKQAVEASRRPGQCIQRFYPREASSQRTCSQTGKPVLSLANKVSAQTNCQVGWNDRLNCMEKNEPPTRLLFELASGDCRSWVSDWLAGWLATRDSDCASELVAMRESAKGSIRNETTPPAAYKHSHIHWGGHISTAEQRQRRQPRAPAAAAAAAAAAAVAVEAHREQERVARTRLMMIMNVYYYCHHLLQHLNILTLVVPTVNGQSRLTLRIATAG